MDLLKLIFLFAFLKFTFTLWGGCMVCGCTYPTEYIHVEVRGQLLDVYSWHHVNSVTQTCIIRLGGKLLAWWAILPARIYPSWSLLSILGIRLEFFSMFGKFLPPDIFIVYMLVDRWYPVGHWSSVHFSYSSLRLNDLFWQVFKFPGSL